MRRTGIYLILLFLLACSRTPHYKKWKVGNWATYQIGKDTVLYTIKDKDSERFWLEMTGDGYCITVLVNDGTIDSIIGYNGNFIDVERLSFEKFNPSVIQTKDTIMGDKRIIIQQLNDTLWISPQVPIFGIVNYGNIHLLDFGYTFRK